VIEDPFDERNTNERPRCALRCAVIFEARPESGFKL
jgi:hypothetical protein